MSKFLELVLDFLKPNSGRSSKRLISLSSMIMLIACFVANCFNVIIQEDLVYSFCILCGGASVLTVLKKDGSNVQSN